MSKDMCPIKRRQTKKCLPSGIPRFQPWEDVKNAFASSDLSINGKRVTEQTQTDEDNGLSVERDQLIKMVKDQWPDLLIVRPVDTLDSPDVPILKATFAQDGYQVKVETKEDLAGLRIVIDEAEADEANEPQEKLAQPDTKATTNNTGQIIKVVSLKAAQAKQADDNTDTRTSPDTGVVIHKTSSLFAGLLGMIGLGFLAGKKRKL